MLTCDVMYATLPTSATHQQANNLTWGGYNHGPIIEHINDTFILSWYNGVMNESVFNRVLFATSRDAVTWSEPAVLFNTTAGTHHNVTSSRQQEYAYTKGYGIGLENEAWVFSEDGARLYGAASSWDVFQRSGHGAEHTGPDAALMRRVVLGRSGGSSSRDAQLGDVFWLADEVRTPYIYIYIFIRTDKKKYEMTKRETRGHWWAVLEGARCSPMYTDLHPPDDVVHRRSRPALTGT